MNSKYSIRRAKSAAPTQERLAARAKVSQAISQSHQALAERLQLSRVAIARMERQTDIYIASLREHIEAMGGQLQVLVRFSEGTLKLHNFIDLDNDPQLQEEPSYPASEPLAGGQKTPVTALAP
ncbi:MAG: transcriptional regulator [Pseudomonas sp.]